MSCCLQMWEHSVSKNNDLQLSLICEVAVKFANSAPDAALNMSTWQQLLNEPGYSVGTGAAYVGDGSDPNYEATQRGICPASNSVRVARRHPPRALSRADPTTLAVTD